MFIVKIGSKRFSIGLFLLGLLVGWAMPNLNSLTRCAIADQGSDYNMSTCVSVLDTARVQKNERGWVHWFAPRSLTRGLNLKMSNVKALQARHAAHSHDAEEIFFVMEGKAEFTLNDEHKFVGANSSLYCPPGVKHGIRNAGDEPLRYLVIRYDE